MNLWQMRDTIQRILLITALFILIISSIFAYVIESDIGYMVIIFNIYVFGVILHNEFNVKERIY